MTSARNIRRKAPAIPLPFPPTENPKPQEIVLAAQAALNMVQALIHNPAAVITVLTAAKSVYMQNVQEKGFEGEGALEQCQDLGEQIASLMLSMQREKASAPKEEETSIIQLDTGIVDANGNPLTA